MPVTGGFLLASPFPPPAPPAVLAQGAWAGATAAIALAVLAIAAVAVAIVVVLAARTAAVRSEALAREVARLREEVGGTLQGVREITDRGRNLAGRVEQEVQAVLQASQHVRQEVSRGVRRARRRLEDLDAVADVVQGEIEETALDLAATLRTVRRGTGMVGRIRRLVRGRR